VYRGVFDGITIRVYGTDEKGAVSRRAFKIFRSDLAGDDDGLESFASRTGDGDLDEFFISRREVIIGGTAKGTVERQVYVTDRIVDVESDAAASDILIVRQCAVRDAAYDAYIGVRHIADYLELFVGQFHGNDARLVIIGQLEETGESAINGDTNDEKNGRTDENFHQSETASGRFSFLALPDPAGSLTTYSFFHDFMDFTDFMD
jgi:hypothetical protein